MEGALPSLVLGGATLGACVLACARPPKPRVDPVPIVSIAPADAGGGGEGPLTTSEREELARLRSEVKHLRQERDILKRATAFFVKEATS